MKRPRLVPSKVFYLWEKLGLRRIELFSGEDLDKKPEIKRDTDKMPELHTQGSFAAAHQRHLDAKNKRRK